MTTEQNNDGIIGRNPYAKVQNTTTADSPGDERPVTRAALAAKAQGKASRTKKKTRAASAGNENGECFLGCLPPVSIEIRFACLILCIHAFGLASGPWPRTESAVNNKAAPSPKKKRRNNPRHITRSNNPNDSSPPHILTAAAAAAAAVKKPAKYANQASANAELNALISNAQNSAGVDVNRYFELANEATVGHDQFSQALSNHANTQTVQYIKMQGRYVTEFMEAAMEHPRLSELVEIIEDPLAPGQYLPLFAAICRGKPANSVRENRIMNTLLKNFFFSKKNKDTGEDLAPTTWETTLKSLLACMKQAFGTSYSLSAFKGYTGSLDAVATKYWAEQVKKDPSFGKKKKGTITDDEHDRVVLFLRSDQFSAFVQQDPTFLLYALNWCVGTFFALRGGKEHKDLRRDSFTVGEYDKNHPLSGFEYLELKDKNLITKVNILRFGTYRINCVAFFFVHATHCLISFDF